MDRRVVTLFGAAIGGVLAYLLFDKLRLAPDAHINLRKEGGRFRSTTEPYTVRKRPRQTVRWRMQPDILDKGAELELVFRDGSPLEEVSPRGRGVILGKVRSDARGHYPYKIWYVRGSERYEVEDPELQIDF